MKNNNYIKIFLKGIDQQKLTKNDENELSKFRVNVVNAVKGILRGEPKEKAKAILALKEGLFELIAQIPVVTPIVTAMLQAITGEDMGSKIDNLSSKMDNLGSKMEIMIELQKQTLNEIADLRTLQKQTIALQKQTITLQKQTIVLQKQTIKEIHKLPERISLKK